MKNVTHYIELYKAGEDIILNQTECLEISSLQYQLNKTKEFKFLKTIVIFKIKLKENFKNQKNK